MAEEDLRILVEDCCVNLRCDVQRIVHHPSLNVLIVFGKTSEFLVVDVSTANILHKGCVSSPGINLIICEYLERGKKIFFSDGNTIGLRSDYNGVVLLDSILQPPLTKSEDSVKLELLLSEAVLLLKSLSCKEFNGVEHISGVIKELKQKIQSSHVDLKKGNKAQKWSIICLELPHYMLKSVFGALVQELKHQNKRIPALPIASAINERLNWLLPSSIAECLTDRTMMCSEAARRETFIRWPHMDYKWALPDEMAEAGFYHQPNATGDDRAMCFTCNVCLVCWEPADHPWEEHLRHSSNCPFVKGEYTQNVPLSVTYATSPAVKVDSPEEVIDFISTTSVGEYVATASHRGCVVVWNVSEHLKKVVCFYVAIPKSVEANLSCIGDVEVHTAARNGHGKDVMETETCETEPVAVCRISCNLYLTALSIVGGPHKIMSDSSSNRPTNTVNAHTSIRPCIVVGIKPPPSTNAHTVTNSHTSGVKNSSVVETVNVLASDISHEVCGSDFGSSINMDVHRTVKCGPELRHSKLCLLVYDCNFYCHSSDVPQDVNGETEVVDKKVHKKTVSSSKQVVWETTSSPAGPKHKEQNLFPEFFLSKFLYEPLDEGEISTFGPPDDVMEGLEYPSSSSASIGFFSPHEKSAGNGGTPYDDNMKFSSGTEEIITSRITSEISPSLVELCCESGKATVSNDTDSAKCEISFHDSDQNSPEQLQCILLPEQFNKDYLYISGIYPTREGNHILVVVETRDYDGNVMKSKPIIPNSTSSNEDWTDSSGIKIKNDDDDYASFSKISAFCKPMATEFHQAVDSSLIYDKLQDTTDKPYRISDEDSLKLTRLGTKCGAILVYSLKLKDEVVLVNEFPVNIREFHYVGESPTKVVLLPHCEREDASVPSNFLDSDGKYPLGLAVLVCRDGAIRILDVSTLKTLSVALPEKRDTKFISAAYCSNMERLCVCSNRGSLHFFVLSFEKDDGVADGIRALAVSPSNAAEAQSPISVSDFHGFDPHSYMEPDLSLFQPLGTSELISFRELTRYVNVTPLYAATAPPCWEETLHAHKKSFLLVQQTNENEYTRSWRLQPETTSWKEHLFEIAVPRFIIIGHVDVKFSLRGPCTEVPDVEISLLKMDSCAIARKNTSNETEIILPKIPVEGLCDDSCFDSSESLNMQPESLDESCTELLCGPVNISSCLDLSALGGTVTLTSPKLHRNKEKLLLVRVRAVSTRTTQANKASSGKETASKRKKGDLPKHNIVDQMMYYLKRDNSKSEVIRGCDWLTEISITLRKPRLTIIRNERILRCTMLENDVILKKLLAVAILEGPDKTSVAQNVALDILNWLASVRLCRRRTFQGSTEPDQLALVQIIEEFLCPLIKTCIIMSGRSIAHKCVKLIITCSEGMKSFLDSPEVPFDGSVLNALLQCLPYILHCTSAGAMRWYFLLFGHVITAEGSADAGQKCATLVQRVAEEMNSRHNPFYMILRTRFGLYKTPLELDLFDAEAPAHIKSSSTPVSYAEVISGDGIAAVGVTVVSSSSASVASSDPIDLKEILGLTAIGAGSSNDAKSPSTQFRQFSSNLFLKGLLEVLPLHFTCHAASDGTKMEKVEKESMTTETTDSMENLHLQESAGTTPTLGSKKTDNDFTNPNLFASSKSVPDSSKEDNSIQAFKKGRVKKVRAGFKIISEGGMIIKDRTKEDPLYNLGNENGSLPVEDKPLDKFGDETSSLIEDDPMNELGEGTSSIHVEDSPPDEFGDQTSSLPINDSSIDKFGNEICLPIESNPMGKFGEGNSSLNVEANPLDKFSDRAGPHPIEEEEELEEEEEEEEMEEEEEEEQDQEMEEEEEELDEDIIEEDDEVDVSKIPVYNMLSEYRTIISDEYGPSSLTYSEENINNALDGKEVLDENGILKVTSDLVKENTSDNLSNPFLQKTSSFETPTVLDPELVNTSDLSSCKKQEVKQDAGNSLVLPWQKLLTVPPQYSLVIERMHSAARRYVVLDFGYDVLLTDVLIPSCPELVALFIDTWCESEKLDGQRLIVSTDIGSKTLVMSDIQPPPLCRYLKITGVGRLGMSTTKCKIPLGSFYGHVIALPGEELIEYREPINVIPRNIEVQLKALKVLYEDLLCHYNLSSMKLKELLSPYLSAEMPSMQHVYQYFKQTRDHGKTNINLRELKILHVLSECSGFQHQLNLIQNVVTRLETAFRKDLNLPDVPDLQKSLMQASTDKLRVVSSCLLDVLLYLGYDLGPLPKLSLTLSKHFDQTMCQQLFSWLCVREEASVQLATCALLVKMCGFQTWWGDFLAEIFSTLFSSRNMLIFPQDRVFILLTYMGRKALSGGAPSVTIISSVLSLLSELLSPVYGGVTNIFKADIDTCQIEWILLFLSVCLDLKGNSGFWSCMEEEKVEAHSNNMGQGRWDFMQGEIAIQRLAVAVQNAKKNIRRKLKEQLMHANLEEARDDVAAQFTRTCSSVRRREAEHLFKVHPQFARKIHVRKMDPDPSCMLPQNLVLPVAKGLIIFLLKMDFSCNLDMFLLACKVLANIVTRTCPAMSLAQLMSEQQLLQLSRLGVWNDYYKVTWGGSWAFHAICCLLEEILETERLNIKKVHVSSQEDADHGAKDMDNLTNSGLASSNQNMDLDVDTLDDICSSGVKEITTTDDFLPALLESDGSDLDDSEEVIDVKPTPERNELSGRFFAGSSSIISNAVDYRLECGVEMSVNITLRRIVSTGACHLSHSLNAPIKPPDEVRQISSSHEIKHCVLQSTENVTADTLRILTNVFETLFVELSMPNPWTNLELILQLWLNLNKIIGADHRALPFFFDPSMVPCIYLSPAAVSGIIVALSSLPAISLRAWCLGFQCLTSLANSPLTDVGSLDHASTWTPETVEDIENSLIGMAKIIIGDAQFLSTLLRFFSGSGVLGMQSSTMNAGPDVCIALHNFLVRLQMRCDVVTTNSRIGNFFKERLLKLVYQLIQPSGPVACYQGPLDAQCDLIDMLLILDYNNIDLSTATSILECAGILIYNYTLNTQDVQCRKGTESGTGGTVCFSRFKKAQAGSQSSPSKPISWNYLMCSLLKLCSCLVRTPLNTPVNIGRRYAEYDETSDQSSAQTDEHKVAEQQNTGDGSSLQSSRAEKKVPCVADTVLQHLPTMMRLLMSLAGCKASEFALLFGPAAASEPSVVDTLGDIYDPTTVGDYLFKLLVTLSQKASTHQLILKPLLSFLSTGGLTGSMPLKLAVGVIQLSEPLLWFILRVLNCESALEAFNNMGGIKVLSENLVRSNRVLLNAHPGLVSTLIQHFSTVPQHFALHEVKGTPFPEIIDGLVNFAPLGSISTSSPTAQCPDVLILSTPLHRRARTAAWTYHFYEAERSMALTITLPCAVLLKEVHLQPHLTSLATCPSAVAIDILRDENSGYIPLCGPVPTSGLTFIRLQFQPEVAVTIVLRLYKPADSNSIGLSQLRILGLTTFGETFTKQKSVDLPQEDSYCRSGLGWLRLLHHCLHLPDPNSEVARSQLTAAADVKELLESFLGMFLISAPSASAFMPKLEYILLKLGYHNPDFGLEEVDCLLRKGPAVFAQGTWPVCMPEVYSSPALDAVAHLLFELCTSESEYFGRKIQILVFWLHEKAIHASQHSQSTATWWYPQATIVHCVGCILWWVKEQLENKLYELSALITEELFSDLWKWTGMLPAQSVLKKAIDRVLCSICYIKLEYFPVLLQWLGVLDTRKSHHRASLPDDRKHQEPQQLYASITDDSKEMVSGVDQNPEKESFWYKLVKEQDLQYIDVNECHLMTVASVCQSPGAIYVLLDSGLPLKLVQSIIEFCHHEQQILEQYAVNGTSMDKNTRNCFNESLMTDSDKANDMELKNLSPDSSEVAKPLLRTVAVSKILLFFTEICDEVTMKDWFGTTDGSSFWSPLLKLLCARSSLSAVNINNESNRSDLRNVVSHVELEDATLKFLSKCCAVHPINQRLMSEVLCDILSKQCSLKQSIPWLHGICGFMRQLFLQLLLENEKVFVFLSSPVYLGLWYSAWPPSVPNHPRFGLGHNRQLLYLDTDTTVEEITKHVACDGTLSSSSIEAMIPGLTSLELKLYHSISRDEPLPGKMTLSQVLCKIGDIEGSCSQPYINFIVDKLFKQTPKEDKDTKSDVEREDLLFGDEIATPLHIFTQSGGLALLAQQLSLSSAEAHLSEAMEIEQPKGESSVDSQEDSLSEKTSVGIQQCIGTGSRLPIPSHSLAAFRSFLRLPGYAEVLLRDRKKARCLLRLVLGFTDDGEVGELCTREELRSLPTLPFHVLQQLFEATPLTTDDGVLLRRTTIEIGAMHLILSCLSVLSHQGGNIYVPGVQTEFTMPPKPNTAAQYNSHYTDEKSNLYWAKGTGFSTGSTAQSWNVEEALSRQRNEDEHVTVLLQVIACYIYPEDYVPSEEHESSSRFHLLPAAFHDLLLNSCLLSALCAYLRNDSVLDISRHIPLYLAVLDVVRAIAHTPQLVKLLLPEQRENGQESSDDTSLVQLLQKMNECVHTYASRLKIDVTKEATVYDRGHSKIKSGRAMDSDEGLVILIVDILRTSKVVEDATQKVLFDNQSMLLANNIAPCSVESPLQRSCEEVYLEVMKRLQFDTFEMITENPQGGYQFVVSYHFESDVRTAGERNHPSRMKRLAQEAVTLSTSLPLSYSSSVFVRCDTDRLDIMKVLITGPSETPYANGCFEFDVYFPSDYPNSPMLINFKTTGRRSVRFNPNLYTDGRVCLSVLNTWHGRPEERWNSQTSSFLQVLVSIQSLILVPEPYFNEPGYERSRGSTTGNLNSKEYNANIYRSTAKWAMLEQIRNPCPCFREVIHTHFWLKQNEVIRQIQYWINFLKFKTMESRTDQAISFHRLALQRHLQELKKEFALLKPPEGYEYLDVPSETTIASPATAPNICNMESVSDASQNHNVCAATISQPSDIVQKQKVEICSGDSDVQMEKMVSDVCENL